MDDRGVSVPVAELPHRCGVAARWLPRTLAASVLIATLLVSARIESWRAVPGVQSFRLLLVLAAAVLALWIVRKGGEVRMRIGVRGEEVAFAVGSRQAVLRLDDVEGLRFEPPLAATRHWLPAAVLLDREARYWRLPAVLEHGDQLVRELLEASGREDLRTWDEVYSLRRRMGRPGRTVALGYTLAGALILAAGIFYLR
jgi:hypothetical protein